MVADRTDYHRTWPAEGRLNQGKGMRGTIWMAALAAATLACGQVLAAEPAKGAFLVVHHSIDSLHGQMYGTDLGVVTQTIAANYINNAAPVPGMSYGQAYGAGMAGGLVAGMIIEGAAQAARNRTIAAVRNPLDDRVLQRAMLAAMDKHLADAGHPVSRQIITPSANERVIRRAVGKDTPGEVILFDAKGMPLVMLSTNNRRVLVQGDLALYAREKSRYTRQQRMLVAFVSPQSPDGVDPIAYWAEDNSRRVLEIIDVAIGRMVGIAMAAEPVTLPEVAADARLDVVFDGSADGKPVSAPGVFLRQEGDYAYVVTAGDWVRIWPARLAPAEATAAPVAATAQ